MRFFEGRTQMEVAGEIGISILIISGIAGIISGVLLCFARPIVYALFNLPGETQALCGMMLLIVAAAMPFRAMLYSSIVGILRGGGDVHVALLIDVLPMYLFGIPLAWLAAFVWKLPAQYVYGCLALEEVVKNIFAAKRIASKKWVRNITRSLDA